MKREHMTLLLLAAGAYFIYRWYLAGGRVKRGKLWPWGYGSLFTPSASAPLSDGTSTIQQGH